MWNRVCIAVALAGLAAMPVGAQTAKPGSAEAAAEAAAAMERAQRLAASPMRVILQAGKIRRKTNEPETPPEAADAALRRTAARAGAESLVAAAGSVVAATAVAAVTAPARPASPEAVATASTALFLQASPLSVPATAAVAGLENTAPAALPVVALPTLTLPETLPVARAAQPKLVSAVEPDIPFRLLQDMGRVNEVAADLSLRADGTVAEVRLIAPYPRSWRSYIVAAMEQWRFEPLGSARVHRVQLVFSEPS